MTRPDHSTCDKKLIKAFSYGLIARYFGTAKPDPLASWTAWAKTERGKRIISEQNERKLQSSTSDSKRQAVETTAAVVDNNVPVSGAQPGDDDDLEQTPNLSSSSSSSLDALDRKADIASKIRRNSFGLVSAAVGTMKASGALVEDSEEDIAEQAAHVAKRESLAKKAADHIINSSATAAALLEERGKSRSSAAAIGIGVAVAAGIGTAAYIIGRNSRVITPPIVTTTTTPTLHTPLMAPASTPPPNSLASGTFTASFNVNSPFKKT